MRGEPVVRPPHLVRTVVAHAYPSDLAGLDRLREGVHQTVYPEGRTRKMDLVEVYGRYPESLQTLVYGVQKGSGAQAVREGGELGGYCRRPLETALAQHLADDPLRSAVAVDLRRVHERDALGHASPEGRPHVAAVVLLAIPPEPGRTPRPGPDTRGSDVQFISQINRKLALQSVSSHTFAALPGRARRVDTFLCADWPQNLRQTTTTSPLRLSQNHETTAILETVLVCSE